MTIIRAYDNAPPQPTIEIEKRRWWNQIVIDSLTKGIPSGCHSFFGSYSCDLCGRCNHRDDMTDNPNHRFIGFTKQQ